MSDKNSKAPVDKKRRGALKVAGTSAAGIVTAASLPSQWQKPILDSIVLPAHAQTSPGTGTDGGTDSGDGAATTAAATTAAAVTTTSSATTTVSMTTTNTLGQTTTTVGQTTTTVPPTTPQPDD